jgi:hypothetical protein
VHGKYICSSLEYFPTGDSSSHHAVTACCIVTLFKRRFNGTFARASETVPLSAWMVCQPSLEKAQCWKQEVIKAPDECFSFKPAPANEVVSGVAK